MPEQQGMTADCCMWQPSPYCANGFNAWIQPSMLAMPCQQIPERRVQLEVDPSPRSSNSQSEESAPEPRRVQSAARAAKRQRGRERRKMYKALAHEEKSVEDRDVKALEGFEARAATVASQVKLVVNRTFFEVESAEESSSEEDVQLPPSFFQTTTEIDTWRRDYRRFRLGHHQGAKGEVTAKDLSFFSLPAHSFLEARSGPCSALPA